MPDGNLEKLTPHKDGKRRKMIMTKLTAVALTATGSNPHADVTFFKSKAEPNTAEDENVEKRSFLVSANDGHSHLVSISDFTKMNMAGETSWQNGHDHPFVINDDGSVEVGEAAGHTHIMTTNVADLIKSLEADNSSGSVNKNAAGIGGGQEHKEDIAMPKDKNADNNAAKEVDALKAKLARAENLATLTDTQKVHFNALDESNQGTFLLKSNDERDADIAVVKDADTIVYKADNGSVYHKSDDPRLVDMAKQGDIDRKDLAKERAANSELVYKERAKVELANLPGKPETHVAILKSIDSIEDKETRDAAMSALKAKNASFAGTLEEIGTSEQPTVSKTNVDANSTLDNLAKKYVADNPALVEKHGNNAYYEAYEIVSTANPETLQKAMAG